MIEDIDIYRTAAVLVEKHGKDAPIHAAMRADELLAEGDIEGRAVWIRILKVTEEILNTSPTFKRSMH